MDRITAPYGFIPLSEKVVQPAWSQPYQDESGQWRAPPLHDKPFEDGICGSLDIEIEAETPVFTRGVDGKFFTLPDGRPALPGTLLKGAIRNIVEAASFGRMAGRVNDHRYAVRDLQNEDLYRRFMAGIVRDKKTGKQQFMPLVNAGLLKRHLDPKTGESVHTIEVRNFARIHYQKLQSIAHDRGIRRFDPGQKQSAVAKYRAWGKVSREVQVEVKNRRPGSFEGRVMPSEFGQVENQRGNHDGVLVFTGQPSRWDPTRRNKGRVDTTKRHDFVFLSPRKPWTYSLDGRVFRDFEFAHSDRGQQNRLGRSETPNEEWGFWLAHLEKGRPVPVFFLTDPEGREITAFGLTMMFRLPYRFSIGDAVNHTQGGSYSSDAPRFDMADGLFGAVVEHQGQPGALALKSRVDFSHAKADEDVDARGKAVRVVLGSPKASYYPNYVEQVPGTPGANAPRNRGSRSRYTTWQDANGRPRGWKRYRALTDTWHPDPPTGAGGRPLSLDKVATTFVPLPAGTRFRGRVFLHNVRPAELGALLWALELGGDDRARHGLGMARPLGYGRCSLKIKESRDLRNMGGRPVDAAACRQAFAAYMNHEIPDWAESEQIQELLALARPIPPEQARYQRLDPGKRVNDFVTAKKQGLALPTAHAGPRDATSGPFRTATSQRHSSQPDRQRGGPGGGTRAGNAGLSKARQAWPGKRRGDVLEVQLTETNRKGKWRATVVGYDAKGTIEGSPPDGAEPGAKYEVEVIQGGDPRNLNLKWQSGAT